MKKKELYKINTSKLWNDYNYVKKYDDFKYTKEMEMLITLMKDVKGF